MSHELELSSSRRPDTSTVIGAFTDAWQAVGLPAPAVTGDLEDDPLVELVDTTTDRLAVQILRPRHRAAATSDQDRWHTTVLLDSAPLAVGTEEQAHATRLDASLTALRDLAHRLDGDLHERPDEQPDDQAAPARAASAEAFFDPAFTPTPLLATVMLDVHTPGDHGWRTLLSALRTWVGTHHDLLPALHSPDGTDDWEPLDPTGPAPEWWPLSRYLASPDGSTRWEVTGCDAPGDLMADLSLSTIVPDAGAAARGLVRTLEDLAPWRPQYALIHPADPRDPDCTTGIRRHRDGSVLLGANPRALLERGLPDLGWATLLGPAWTTLIGPDRIATSPAHTATEVLPDTWLLQLTPDPDDVHHDHDAYTHTRTLATDHLGPDLFTSTPGPTRLPRLLDLAQRGIVPRPSW